MKNINMAVAECKKAFAENGYLDWQLSIDISYKYNLTDGEFFQMLLLTADYE